jgi:hypothetical protein
MAGPPGRLPRLPFWLVKPAAANDRRQRRLNRAKGIESAVQRYRRQGALAVTHQVALDAAGCRQRRNVRSLGPESGQSRHRIAC